MLAHRLRRWPNIGQTLARCLVLPGSTYLRHTDMNMSNSCPEFKAEPHILLRHFLSSFNFAEVETL